MAQKHDKAAARAYLLRGDDEFQKREALNELLRGLVAAEFADFDLEEVEAETATCDRIIAGLNVPPFGPGRRVVLVRFANKMNPEEQSRLAQRLETTPTSGCLVMVNPAVDRSDGKPRKGSEVIAELARAIRKVGEVREFGGETAKERANRARQFAVSRFQSAGKQISSEALALFVQRAGDDFGILATEARKLIDYAGDRERITRADVELVTSETPEEKVFKMVDAVAEHNPATAMKLLDELFESGDDPRADAPRALAMIARQFRLIWQARMLMDAGVKRFEKEAVPAEVRTALPASGSLLDVPAWQATRAARQARNFPYTELARCFEALARADAALKGAEGDIDDPRTIMELLVIELAGSKR